MPKETSSELQTRIRKELQNDFERLEQCIQRAINMPCVVTVQVSFGDKGMYQSEMTQQFIDTMTAVSSELITRAVDTSWAKVHPHISNYLNNMVHSGYLTNLIESLTSKAAEQYLGCYVDRWGEFKLDRDKLVSKMLLSIIEQTAAELNLRDILRKNATDTIKATLETAGFKKALSQSVRYQLDKLVADWINDNSSKIMQEALHTHLRQSSNSLFGGSDADSADKS